MAYGTGGTAIVDNNVIARSEICQKFSKRLAHYSLQAVAHYRVAMLTRHRNAETRWFVSVLIYVVESQSAIPEHLTVCINAIVIRSFVYPMRVGKAFAHNDVRHGRGLMRQALASLCAPTLKNTLSPFAAHALAKAVLTFLLSIAGLKSSLHYCAFPLLAKQSHIYREILWHMSRAFSFWTTFVLLGTVNGGRESIVENSTHKRGGLLT